MTYVKTYDIIILSKGKGNERSTKMRAQNITIDINVLDTDQLVTLAGMVGDPNKVKQINERIAFIEGRMTREQEEKYFEEFC